MFERIVVGVDGTDASFEACRQTAVLAEPDAAVEAVAVVHLADAVHAGLNAAALADVLQREAEAALDEAVGILGPRTRRRFVNGFATQALLAEVARTRATAIAIGSHGHRRATEILIGGVAGELLHTTPCSVLITRPPATAGSFPRSIVVGIDGSREADAALAAAQQLAGRLRVPLRIVAARGGKGIDRAHVHLRAALAEETDRGPVEALVAASRDAGLVVVGSRGLHGVRALGSVSERVAHRASCSVLVVRCPATA